MVPTEKHVFVLFWFLFSFKERIKTSHSKFVYFLVFMVLPKRRNTIHNLGGGVDIYIAFYLQTDIFETVFRSNLAVWVFQPTERMRTTFLKRNDCRLTSGGTKVTLEVLESLLSFILGLEKKRKKF